MIGRASIGYPWVFNEIKHFLATGEHIVKPGVKERVEATRDHLNMSVRWKGEELGINEMKRHYTNYFKGISHFKDYRMKLVSSQDLNEILETLDFIEENNELFQFALAEQ
jgi:tRNA-dihydrouridine synthase